MNKLCVYRENFQIENLEDFNLIEIFSYLNCYQLANISLVSHRWRELAHFSAKCEKIRNVKKFFSQTRNECQIPRFRSPFGKFIRSNFNEYTFHRKTIPPFSSRNFRLLEQAARKLCDDTESRRELVMKNCPIGLKKTFSLIVDFVLYNNELFSDNAVRFQQRSILLSDRAMKYVKEGDYYIAILYGKSIPSSDAKEQFFQNMVENLYEERQLDRLIEFIPLIPILLVRSSALSMIVQMLIEKECFLEARTYIKFIESSDDQAVAFMNLSEHLSVDQAFDLALLIQNKSEKLDLRNLVHIFIYHGQILQASKMISMMHNNRYCLDSSKQLVETLLEFENYEKAKQFVEKIEDNEAQAELYSALCPEFDFEEIITWTILLKKHNPLINFELLLENLLNLGLIEDAEELALVECDEGNRAFFLKQVVLEAFESDQFGVVMRLLPKISNEHERSKLYTRLAIALAKFGRVESAKEVAELIVGEELRKDILEEIRSLNELQ